MKVFRYSKLFIPTLKDAPADAQVPSHKLLVRAGFIRQLGAGIYDYLPLGKRTLTKIEAILREEMAAIGAQEFYLPALHPAEIWRESGRWDAMGDNMFRLGAHAGSLGAVAFAKAPVLVDHALAGRTNMVTGANEDGFHLRRGRRRARSARPRQARRAPHRGGRRGLPALRRHARGVQGARDRPHLQA